MGFSMATVFSRVFSKIGIKTKSQDLIGEIDTESHSVFTAQDSRYIDYKIGAYTYGSPQVLTWNNETSLTIGRFCSIADGAIFLLGGEHRTDWVTTYPFNVLFEEARAFVGHPASKGDVVIQNDVWVGYDAIILSGVTVGNGSVVASRSVVTKDVPPYSIVGGNPAHIIRRRFSDTQITALQEIAWWDWPIERIREAWPLLLASDIDAFIQRYG